jgi:UDP-N-acetyl-2-amino-2-deoxyglucuronate dehydrogenase
MHTIVYRHTLDGQGFGIDEARPSINLTHEIRNAKPTRTSSNYLHPFLK